MMTLTKRIDSREIVEKTDYDVKSNEIEGRILSNGYF